MASFFLAGDPSNRLNGGHGRGSDKGFEGERQQGGASVVVEQAPFISPVVRQGEFGGNCASQRPFGRKAFGPGLEGHSSGEWVVFWTTHGCLADGTRHSASVWCVGGIIIGAALLILLPVFALFFSFLLPLLRLKYAHKISNLEHVTIA